MGNHLGCPKSDLTVLECGRCDHQSFWIGPEVDVLLRWVLLFERYINIMFLDYGSEDSDVKAIAAAFGEMKGLKGGKLQPKKDQGKTSLRYEVPRGGSKSKCHVCGVASSNLLRCGRCKAVWYCSEECQKKDWRKHKKMCTEWCPSGRFWASWLGLQSVLPADAMTNPKHHLRTPLNKHKRSGTTNPLNLCFLSSPFNPKHHPTRGKR